MIFKIGRRVGFADLAPLPYFVRPVPQVKRKKTFKSFWMTTDENFDTVKRIETETAQKKADKEDDQKVAKEAVSKNKKLRAQKKKVGEEGSEEASNKSNKKQPKVVKCSRNKKKDV